ncbi:MAG: arginine repressor [Clostridiales bacterium]|jgi:arginine repressor|nr:arginine repressor [Clostridiales bacterium]
MKNKRQNIILEIISSQEIETQEELIEKLAEKGYPVTQATVSRDIKELKLVKVSAKNHKTKYAPLVGQALTIPEQLMPVFAHGFVSADFVNNLVIVKTLPGMAQAVASAIDSLKLTETLGTIAGDDALLIVCRTEDYAQSVVMTLKSLVK